MDTFTVEVEKSGGRLPARIAMAMFRHSSYGKQQGVTTGKRGQVSLLSSSFGFNLPKRSSSLGGVGAMIASDRGNIGYNEQYGGLHSGSEMSGVGIQDSGVAAPSYDDRAYALNDHLKYSGIGSIHEKEKGIKRSIRVTRSFYELYMRLFENCAGENISCNLHAFVHTVEEEDDETLFILLNDPLLMRLAKEEPRKLIQSYPSKPEFITFNELIHRLQNETRLDFSDVHFENCTDESAEKRNSSMTLLWNDLKSSGREIYRRFLAMNSNEFANELEHASPPSSSVNKVHIFGENRDKGINYGQKLEPGSWHFEKSEVPAIHVKSTTEIVDLTGGEEGPHTASKSQPRFQGMPLPPSTTPPEAAMDIDKQTLSYAHSARPGKNVHDSESGQGGMGTVQGTTQRSPEEKYKQATARVDELMRKRENMLKHQEMTVEELDSDASMGVQNDGNLVQQGTPSEVVSDRFKELTTADLFRVESVLSGPTSQEVLIEKFNIDMTRNKLVCLRAKGWLNDEVINFYMCMLKERDDMLCAKTPTRRHSHFFNSFFMNKLLQMDGENKYDYKGVRRWSKKFDTFELDKVFVPVNISNTHWTMLIVYVQRKEIHYNDSMSGSGTRFLRAALQWLIDEARDKKGIELDGSEWNLVSGTVPQQANGFDCGVFSIMNADFASEDLEFCYSQKHMPYFRRRICKDILTGSLDYSIPK